MQKPNNKRLTQTLQQQDNRLTTAPLQERTKYSDFYKTSNFQLPLIKGKNNLSREQVIASRDVKRQTVRKQEFSKCQNQEGTKRPQTSKGSRNCKKHSSQYHEQGEDDLVLTSMQKNTQNIKRVTQKHQTNQLSKDQ